LQSANEDTCYRYDVPRSGVTTSHARTAGFALSMLNENNTYGNVILKQTPNLTWTTFDAHGG